LNLACGKFSRLGTTTRSSLRYSSRRRLHPDDVAYAHFTAALTGESCDQYGSSRRGAGVERLAQCAVIPQDVTRRRTRGRSVFPGRPRPLVVTPRGHFRPDKVRRERPPPKRVRGRLRGQRGSLTPPARSPASSARRLRRQRTPPHSRRLRERNLSYASGLPFRCRPRGGTLSIVDRQSSSAV
jgi:hypothetical protein